jgi:hypothetical protein
MTTIMAGSIGGMTVMRIETAIVAVATSASAKSICGSFANITTSANYRPDWLRNTIEPENFRPDGTDESSPSLTKWSEPCHRHPWDTHEAMWMATQSCTSREHTW